MTDGRVSGRRAAPVPPDAERPDAAPAPADPIHAAEPGVVRMWSGPVSVRQPSAFIAVDDALVAPTDYQTAPQAVVETSAPARPRRTLGILSVLVAVVGAVAEGTGIAVASAGDDLVGTVLAVVAIGLTAAAAILGLLAILLGRGRVWGVVGVVLGIATNPLLLVLVLGVLDPTPR